MNYRSSILVQIPDLVVVIFVWKRLRGEFGWAFLLIQNFKSRFEISRIGQSILLVQMRTTASLQIGLTVMSALSFGSETGMFIVEVEPFY